MQPVCSGASPRPLRARGRQYQRRTLDVPFSGSRIDNSSDFGWKTRALYLLVHISIVDDFVYLDNLVDVNFSFGLVEIAHDGICYAWFTNRSMARASCTGQSPWRTQPGIALVCLCVWLCVSLCVRVVVWWWWCW